MRNLVNIGRDKERLYVDVSLVVLIVPNDSKKFGSLVFLEGAPAPVSTGLEPDDVIRRMDMQYFADSAA